MLPIFLLLSLASVPEIKFPTADVTFVGQKSITLKLELARTDAEQARGLMYRTHLDKNAGMVFINAAVAPGAFWMKNTLIPLDIAFFDAQGKINDILQMKPCRKDPCEVYQPKSPYLGAIEMNWDWFKKNEIRVGDRVIYTLPK
ncbi:MAG: DUF192 domain-containing protein [Deinococcaceae bacterium]